MKDYFELRDQQLKFYRESREHNCPVCFTECEVKEYHDSTWNHHVCPKCGWECVDMELYSYD